MKKFGLVLIILLSLAAVLNFYSATSAQSDIDKLLLFSRYDEESQSHSIYLLNATTGAEEKITDLDGQGDAGWLPDGRIWLVDKFNEDLGRLRIYDLETGEESIISENLYPNPCFPSFTWSPNGEYLAYFTGTEDAPMMTVVNSAREIFYSIAVVSQQNVYGMQWSTDAAYIFMRPVFANDDVILIELATGEILTIEDALYPQAQFSPDARFLVYADEANENILLHELATGESLNLAPYFNTLHWSPTGRYLIMEDTLGYAGEMREIYQYYDVQTMTMHTIDLGFSIDTALWSADEAYILLYSDFAYYYSDYYAHAKNLLAYELATGESRNIFNTSGWLSTISQVEDWFVIRYDDEAPLDPYAYPNGTIYINRHTFISESQSPLPTTQPRPEIGIHDPARDESGLALEGAYFILGWQYEEHRVSLFYCGEG